MFSIFIKLDSKLKNIGFLECFFVFSLFATGLFYEWLSCVSSVALCVYLVYLYNKNKKLSVFLSIESLAVLCIVLFYALTFLWAVDKGMAVFGFFKFLPLLFFVLCIMQFDDNKKKSLLSAIPYASAVMAVLSFALSFIPAFTDYFTVSGRLAGFFQYPNTFALLLLIGIIITLTKDKLSNIDTVLFVVLMLGLLATGSRTAFVLCVAALIVIAVINKSKKVRISIISVLLLLVGAAVAYVLVTGDMSTFGRFLSLSFTESTLVGRLLYYQDSLPLILQNPFGLGYDGYYFMQSQIQTGVYSVKFIHNDVLQLLLDIGWLPTALLLTAVFRTIFSKSTSMTNRLIIACILIHGFFDFNLQFLSMFFILLLSMNTNVGKRIVLNKKQKPIFATVLVVISALCIYFSVALFADAYFSPQTALSIYNGNTMAKVNLLPKQDSVDKLNILADDILSSNKNVSLAYSAKALKAYQEGDFEAFINYKLEAISKAPYSIDEYNDYCKKLIIGISLYEKAGDSKSADYCRQKLKAVPNLLARLKEKTSPLAYMIDDKPNFELNPEYLLYARQ